MTQFLNVFNWLSNAGFNPRDYEYLGSGIIATPRVGYEPNIGDYVKVSTVATAAGMVLWVYSTKSGASGIVCGSETLRDDPFHRVRWRIQLLLPQGQLFIE